LAFVAFFAPASLGETIAFLQFFQLLFESHAGDYNGEERRFVLVGG